MKKIKIKLYLQYIEPDDVNIMKKLLFFIFLAFVIVVWQAVSLYLAALEPKTAQEEVAIDTAKVEAGLQTINEVHSYYGTVAYQVILGITAENEKVVVWIPEDEGEIVIKKQNEGISKEQVITDLKAERNPKEIRSVKLGIEKNIPLWEVIYINENDRLTYYYSDFETGELLKRTTP